MAAGAVTQMMRLGRVPAFLTKALRVKSLCGRTSSLSTCTKCHVTYKGSASVPYHRNGVYHQGTLAVWAVSSRHMATSHGSAPSVQVGTIDAPDFEVPEGHSAEEVLENLGPKLARKLKIIQMEFEVMKEMGSYVPDEVSQEEWVSLLQCPTSSSRRRYLRYLRKNENYRKAKEVRKARNQLKREEMETQRRENLAEGEDHRKNTIFMIVRDSTMHQFYNSRLAHAMVDGPDLVLDMDYEHVMQKRECVNTVQQLLMAYGHNRICREPFHLVLTGLKPHGMVQRSLEGHIHSLMLTTTEKSFLELYPKDRLVYLSPNADTELCSFNDDDIYVIGGFVDKSQPQPLSMARAKEQGLRMAKFPLDRHVVWSQGSKALTIDQVIRILLALKDTQDWQEAFKHLPRRKILQ